MKINGSQYYRHLQNYKQTTGAQQQPNTSGIKKDQVEISREAKQLQQNPITQQRQEKIDHLKQQIKNGQYKIDYEGVAEKFQTYWTQFGGRNENGGNRNE